MQSAFGVEHGAGVAWETGVVAKADTERAKGYRKTSHTLAAMGGTSGALGAATGVISRAEAKGRDPMGFTMPEKPSEKPRSPKARARLLGINSRAHGKQAVVAGGLGVASLGLAGAYKHAERKERKPSFGKSRKSQDAARDAGTLGVGGAAVGAGAYNARFLGSAAYQWGGHATKAQRQLKHHKAGNLKLTEKQQGYYKMARRSAGRTAGLKGAGALASAGVAGAGGKAVYDVGRERVKGNRS